MATFTVTRAAAAKALQVSTRTIDRYVNSGKISYKKIANKVLLNNDDVEELKREMAMINQSHSSEVVNDTASTTLKTPHSAHLEKIIDEKIDKFFLIFQEKDHAIEEKNKVIFMLQQRVSELEGKIGNMVALPDYNQEKQLAKIEKEKLEQKIKQLSRTVRGEKTKNNLYLVVLILIIISVIFVYLGFVKGMKF